MFKFLLNERKLFFWTSLCNQTLRVIHCTDYVLRSNFYIDFFENLTKSITFYKEKTLLGQHWDKNPIVEYKAEWCRFHPFCFSVVVQAEEEHQNEKEKENARHGCGDQTDTFIWVGQQMGIEPTAFEYSDILNLV